MQFQTPLIPATLIKRYKRFLADVRLDDGQVVTAHCPNPGAMTGLKDAGLRVWLEPNDDPKKKLKFGWRLAELASGDLVCVDTGLANKVVGEALRGRMIPALAAYRTVKAEQKYGAASRIDFLLSEADLPDVYVEVKSVSLNRRDDWAEFPDTVTARGAKHMGELAGIAAQGKRAVVLYLIQHSACTRFKLAQDIDPTYATAARAAQAGGVEVLCYGCTMTPTGLTLGPAVPHFVD